MKPISLLLVALIGAVNAGGQQGRDQAGRLSVGTCAISGTVTTDEETPRALRAVTVTLSGTGLGSGIQTATDAEGRFTFDVLSPGRFTLSAEKPAYLKVWYGSRTVATGPGMPIVLRDGQQLTGLGVRLRRGAAIEGTVLDENGVALSSAQVTILKMAVVNGERRMVSAGIPWATTDDRGRYRLYGIPPGQYAVRAGGGGSVTGGARLTTKALLADPQSAPDGPPVMRSGSYFPGVPDAAQAELVTLRAGEERVGLDIVSRLVRAARIEGVAVGPSGQPLPDMLVGLANVTNQGVWTSPGGVRPGPDGRFRISSLAPGRYLFYGGASGTVSSDRTDSLSLWTSTEVIVGEGETVETVLPFMPGIRVAGRMSPARSGRALDATALRLELTPLPAVPGAMVRPAPVSPAADGAFAFPSVAPGRYRLTLANGGAWTLLAATFGTSEALDSPLVVQAGSERSQLQVVVTDQASQLSGFLYDPLQRPASEFTVVVFSANRAHWDTSPRRMSGAVRVAMDGSFIVNGLPAGDYYMTAIPEVEPAQLRDPAFLEALLPSALKITLAAGEQKTQDLKLQAR